MKRDYWIKAEFAVLLAVTLLALVTAPWSGWKAVVSWL